MKWFNQTDSPTFVLLCVLYFQRQPFRFLFLLIIPRRLFSGLLFTIDPKYTYTKISLRLLSTWLSLNKEIKPRVCTKSRWRLFIAALFLSLWPQCRVKRVICKTWTGTLATVQTQIRRRRTRRLIRVCTVCLNYRKLRVKWNNLKSPFMTIFSVFTQRQFRPISAVSALICLFVG